MELAQLVKELDGYAALPHRKKSRSNRCPPLDGWPLNEPREMDN